MAKLSGIERISILAHSFRPDTHPKAEHIATMPRQRRSANWLRAVWGEARKQGDGAQIDTYFAVAKTSV